MWRQICSFDSWHRNKFVSVCARACGVRMHVQVCTPIKFTEVLI